MYGVGSQCSRGWCVGWGKEEGTRLRRPYGGNCERPRRAGEKTKSMMISTTRARTLFLFCLGKRRSSTFGKQQQRHGPFLPQSLPFCHAHRTSQFNSPGILSRHTPLLHPRDLSVAFRQGDKEQSAVKQARQRHGPAQVVFPAQDRFSLSSFLVHACSFLHASQHEKAFRIPVSTSEIEQTVCTVQRVDGAVSLPPGTRRTRTIHTLKQKNRQKKGLLSNTKEQQSICPINQNIILDANNNLHAKNGPPPPRPILHTATAPDVEFFSVFFRSWASQRVCLCLLELSFA